MWWACVRVFGCVVCEGVWVCVRVYGCGCVVCACVRVFGCVVGVWF